ncbi:MAG: EAL domain-containing protein, partial [Gammaproteobacteria bacterium]|nr:EAL domain-containing protein [Gammaproteobacteria bacterium]
MFSGKKLTKPSYIELYSTKQEGLIDVSLTLKANYDFFSYYKEISLFSSSIAALLIASSITFLTFKLITVRQSLGRIIHDAIKYSEFVPFYQPVVDSRDGSLLGAEVLVRWQKAGGK